MANVAGACWVAIIELGRAWALSRFLRAPRKHQLAKTLRAIAQGMEMPTPIPICAPVFRPLDGAGVLEGVDVTVSLGAATAVVDTLVSSRLVGVPVPAVEVVEEADTAAVMPLVMLKYCVLESDEVLPSSKMLKKNKLETVRFLAVVTIQENLELLMAFSASASGVSLSVQSRYIEGDSRTGDVFRVVKEHGGVRIELP